MTETQGAVDAPVRLLLAHGAGAGMDHPFLVTLSALLADETLQVVRFNFPYMARMQREGGRRPPDRAPVLLECWREVIAAHAHPRLILAGKSMGGRMAAELADETGAAGLVLLGYPFHPVGKPERWRGEVLKQIVTPTLLLQGERDAFGCREELAGFPFSPAVRCHWLPDGDHSLKPRQRSGLTEADNLASAARLIRAFAHEVRG
ncbi:alpha/beta family hydrolase [Aeromonas schubertii]|uniref:alpha/beta fold hydrolase n=1 Tax=Aeromonas TaxID=642 RepID=UPI0010A7C1D0|nr:alpha/beta family hydrolase [Aeromonas schubertii]QCG47373.1 alpha/beta fold hydrolase [Aeromonas schubertii]